MAKVIQKIYVYNHEKLFDCRWMVNYLGSVLKDEQLNQDWLKADFQEKCQHELALFQAPKIFGKTTRIADGLYKATCYAGVFYFQFMDVRKSSQYLGLNQYMVCQAVFRLFFASIRFINVVEIRVPRTT